MTIRLPRELEDRVRSLVADGLYPSENAVLADAVRSLVRAPDADSTDGEPGNGTEAPAPDPILGLMSNEPELMDEIVAGAYRQRRQERWREVEPYDRR